MDTNWPVATEDPGGSADESVNRAGNDDTPSGRIDCEVHKDVMSSDSGSGTMTAMWTRYPDRRVSVTSVLQGGFLPGQPGALLLPMIFPVAKERGRHGFAVPEAVAEIGSEAVPADGLGRFYEADWVASDADNPH